jgi:catechol 2,3-dioxygenase-like lactoylglutathione lyase family enzyme
MNPEMGYAGELTIATQVTDLERAIAWYREVLGFEIIYKVDGMGWCEMTSPVANVAVGLSQVERPKTTGPVPVWSVADIDKARAALERRHVRFDGETLTIEGMVRLATFFDPDGNAWMLSQSLSRR